jgi:hypothetical protein
MLLLNNTVKRFVTWLEALLTFGLSLCCDLFLFAAPRLSYAARLFSEDRLRGTLDNFHDVS